MDIMALLSGAKGEEAHHLYKEEDGSHGSSFLCILIFRFMFCLDLLLS